jgi:hypothetical protein
VKQPSAYRYRAWEKRLIHINQRRGGLPEGLLSWTEEYFGKSPAVQRLLGLNNAMKPEAETAKKVIELLQRRGVRVLDKKRSG